MPSQDPPDPVPDAQRPLDARAVLAWESEGPGFVERLLRTLGCTFSPTLAAPQMIHGALAPALTFALGTMAPWMLAWGVLPFTRTLHFAPGTVLEVTAGTDAQALTLDVLRAGTLGFFLSTLTFLSWALPFASLASAFAADGHPQGAARRAALRSALYCGWVIPFGMAALYLVTWLSPNSLDQASLDVLVLALRLVPRFLVLAHCHAVARQLGASYLGALGVSFVPLAVEWAAGALLWTWADTLLPPPPKSGAGG